jgi:hypothetical protein
MKAQSRRIMAIFLVTMGTASATGRLAGQNAQPISVQTPAALNILFSRVVVTLKDGRFLTGSLLGLEDDSLVLRVGKNIEKILQNDMAKLQIETETKTASPIFYGIIGGLYLGNIFFGRANEQPTLYMANLKLNVWTALINLVFAGVGGGAGYLASSIFDKGTRTFEFSGDEPQKSRAWGTLKKFILGISNENPNHVHIGVQAGYVFRRALDEYQSVLRSAGFNSSPYDDYGFATYFGNYGVTTNKINLLRKVYVSYSLRPNIDFGAAVVFLGEPEEFFFSSSYAYPYSYVYERLDGEGYYLTGSYKPFRSKLPKGMSWNVGLGAGAARIKFNVHADVYQGPPNYRDIASDKGFSKYFLSGVVFTEFLFDLPGGLSLGLAADYAIVPSHQTSAIPEAGLPAHKLKLGNASLGVVLGTHF